MEDFFEGFMVFGLGCMAAAIVLTFVHFIGLAIYLRRYPTYRYPLSAAARKFIESEERRVFCYLSAQKYPVYFQFLWIREVALVLVGMTAAFSSVLFIEYSLIRTMGKVKNSDCGDIVFNSIPVAPLSAAFAGIVAALIVSNALARRSERYSEWTNYYLLRGFSSIGGSIKHFFRAGIYTGTPRKSENELAIMIANRYEPIILIALKITCAVTVILFAFDMYVAQENVKFNLMP